ncbi:Protein YaiI [hydrothermal vent metagenome]|uniref:Protein YaiI n=1 Tax=hydrothermal vent metagenome TaxID=652676 RepID=A0A3B1A317_9ZZZZ
MKIWVDADACPVAAKEILYRAAERKSVKLILVANHALQTPKSKHISTIQVPHGFDVADNEIVKQMQAEDLVITADIPLAADVIAKEGAALSPRGEIFTVDNIRERLSMRDFMESLRSSGVQTGGPNVYGQRERQAFANALDRFLQQQT